MGSVLPFRLNQEFHGATRPFPVSSTASFLSGKSVSSGAGGEEARGAGAGSLRGTDMVGSGTFA